MAHRITLIPGDGIGPEVVEAAQRILEAAGVEINWDVHHAGLEVARLTGTPLPPSVIEAVRKNRVALKGPVTTPIGQGFRSVNVTLRQTLDLYANVRPIRSLPNVESRFGEGRDHVHLRGPVIEMLADCALRTLEVHTLGRSYETRSSRSFT